MKTTADSALSDLLLHLLVAALGGALAFRACQGSHGWGSQPPFAIPAGLATGMLAFLFSLIFFDMVEERWQRRVQWILVTCLAGVHLVAFGLG